LEFTNNIYNLNSPFNPLTLNEIDRFKNTIILGIYLCLIVLMINFFNVNYYKRLFNNIISEYKNEERLDIKKRIELDYFTELIGDEKIAKITLKYAAKYNIESTLFIALMKAESGFNPMAINYNLNNSIDRGLYQLNSKTFTHLEPHEFFNPEVNIENAAIFLSWCMQKSEKNIVKALAYYNAGIGSVTRKNVGESTLNYINNIINDKIIYDNDISKMIIRNSQFLITAIN